MGCTCSSGNEVKKEIAARQLQARLGQAPAHVPRVQHQHQLGQQQKGPQQVRHQWLKKHAQVPAEVAGGNNQVPVLPPRKVRKPSGQVTVHKKKALPVDEPCFICGVDFGSRFHCGNSHVICKQCFHNQVASWSDLVSGDCNKLEPLLSRARGAKDKNAKLSALRSVQLIDKVVSLDIVGDIPCCMPGCGLHIRSFEAVSALATAPEILESYNRARRHQGDKLDQERKRLLRQQGEVASPVLPLKSRERSAREIFMEEQLLTLHCPTCSLAVVDFSDCFAVQCAGCQLWFCAWCLNFSGDCKEAHAHVSRCEENPLPDKSVWSTEEKFIEHHQKRRLSKCVDFLKREADPSLEARVLPLLEGALGHEALYAVQATHHSRLHQPKQQTPLRRRLIVPTRSGPRF